MTQFTNELLEQALVNTDAWNAAKSLRPENTPHPSPKLTEAA
jgi:hypothetical protein